MPVADGDDAALVRVMTPTGTMFPFNPAKLNKWMRMMQYLPLPEITDEQALDVFHVTSKEDGDDGVNYDELFQVNKDLAPLSEARRFLT